MKKLVFVFAMLFAIAMTAEAQGLFNRVKESAKWKARSKVESAIDRGIDKALDKTLPPMPLRARRARRTRKMTQKLKLPTTTHR